MFDKLKNPIYLRMLYMRYLEKSGFKSTYFPYEHFLKNVTRSKRNEEISNLFLMFFEQACLQNESVREKLDGFDCIFKDYITVLKDQDGRYDFELHQSYWEEEGIYRYTFSISYPRSSLQVLFYVSKDTSLVTKVEVHNFGHDYVHPNPQTVIKLPKGETIIDLNVAEISEPSKIDIDKDRIAKIAR